MHGEGTFTDNVGHRYSGNWSNIKDLEKGLIFLQEIKRMFG